LKINVDFLDKDKKYLATFYEDTAETHFLDNKEAYRIRANVKVEKGDELTVKLAPGGGNAVWLRPE
jgi:glucan 1,4-alpha-glucosidase